MKTNYAFISLFIGIFSLLSSCDQANEVAFAGENQHTITTKYTDAVSGLVRDLPAGAEVNIYFQGNPSPISTSRLVKAGLFTYKAPAVGQYKVVIQKRDTLLQFNSALVKPIDTDPDRRNEFDYLTYRDSTSFHVRAGSRTQGTVNLKTAFTGIRVKSVDISGNALTGTSLCAYNNLDFYQRNSPNCGGSIKYLLTNHEGIALLTGLKPNTTYYINAKGRSGVVELNNRYDISAQTFTSGSAFTIKDIEIVLK